ncbi:hypothetical protein ACJX0J_017661, partial [Zea mays]
FHNYFVSRDATENCGSWIPSEVAININIPPPLSLLCIGGTLESETATQFIVNIFLFIFWGTSNSEIQGVLLNYTKHVLSFMNIFGQISVCIFLGLEREQIQVVCIVIVLPQAIVNMIDDKNSGIWNAHMIIEKHTLNQLGDGSCELFFGQSGNLEMILYLQSIFFE